MENTTTLGTPIVCITKLPRTYGEYLNMIHYFSVQFQTSPHI